jgi:signal peptidase II
MPHFLSNTGTKITLSLAAFVLVLDQATKWLVAEYWGPNEVTHRHSLVGDVIAIHYVENTGVAFGLLEGRTAFVTILALIVMGTLVLTFRRAESVSWPATVASGLVLGGALGNLIDRVRLGHVVDFVEVWSWPKFNVADSAITIGALTMGMIYLCAPGGPKANDAELRGTLVVQRDGK